MKLKHLGVLDRIEQVKSAVFVSFCVVVIIAASKSDDYSLNCAKSCLFRQ